MKAAARTALDMVGGIAVSVMCFFAVKVGHDQLTRAGIEVPLFGDKGNVLWGLLLGLPIGAAAGLWIVERAVCRVRPPVFRAFVLGFIPAVVSMYLGLFLVDRLGTVVFLGFPLVVAGLLTAALRIVSAASRPSPR